MSDEEGSDGPRKKNEDPMPEYKMRFTDLSEALVEKAIRCKLNYFYNFLQVIHKTL